MSPTRRTALSAFLIPAFLQDAQQQAPDNHRTLPGREQDEEDTHLPNGKSQKDAISKQVHEEALKQVEQLIHIAEELRDEIKRSGEYVVAVSSVRKTEEIEKLARHIRSKLKA